MTRLLLLLLTLTIFTYTATAQQTTFTPICGGTDDTSRFTSIISNIGANTGTIRLPYKNGTRCAVNTLTIPSNIALDNSDGTGIKVNAGQVLTVVGPVVNPVGKPMFFGPGSTVFTGNTVIGSNGQSLVADGTGGTSWVTITGSGGGGAVDSVFGRTGPVVAVTNDYTWAQIDKTVSSLADLTFRSASELSNGTTGTGAVVLRDSPSLITPVLGVATATSINGLSIATTSGGSLSIASGKSLTASNTLTLAASADGFTFTIPATGTAVLDSRTITEGAGLAGNTYDLSANRTLAMGTPSSLSVSSLTSVSGTTHSHAIASSSNPGAAPVLLASNVSGHLQLVRLGLGIAPTQPLEVNGNVLISAATANLFLKDTSTGWQSASSTVVTPQVNNAIRSTNYTSGLVGWNINAVGDAEFNNLTARGEIRSSVFKVNEIAATAGTLGVFFSAAALTTNAVIPASGSFTFDAKNSDAGGMLFGIGDIVRFKGLSSTGVSDTWATITARVNNGATTAYTATLNSGSASTTFNAGMAVVDYGPSGTGFITLSTDGTVGASPNLTMATHAGTPWSALTTRLRTGNLNGSYGYASDIYGFGVGQYGTAGQSWLTVDPTNGVRIGNNTTTLTQIDAAGNASFTGSITATSGTIAGWTINATSLTKNEVKIAAGVDWANVVGTGEAWFGKSSTGYYGLLLKGTTGAVINLTAGHPGVGSAGRPYLQVHDGARSRVIIGELNTTAWDGVATDSMGMKIWSSAGVKLVEFSDVQNSISGWTIGTNTIASTGVNLHSGASAGLAFGTTPPTSASAGTGIWLDRTGLYGLLSNVVQAKMDATTGAITAGAGAVVLNASGLSITNGSAGINQIKFVDGGNVIATVIGDKNLGESLAALTAGSPAGDATGFAEAALQASSTGFASEAGIFVVAYGASHASSPSKGHIVITPDGGGGVLIGEFAHTSAPTASTILDLNSTTGAFLPPRMTTTQRNALTPTAGMVIYNTSTNKHQGYNGSTWNDFY